MILHRNLYQDQNGAAHRVNFDTPPLKGLRLEPFRFHWGTCGWRTACGFSAISEVPSGTAIAKANRR
jgi:hypothetical protein